LTATKEEATSAAEEMKEEDAEEEAKAAHLSPGDKDRMDLGEREEAASAATAALGSAGAGAGAGVLPEKQQLRCTFDAVIVKSPCHTCMALLHVEIYDADEHEVTRAICMGVNVPPASTPRLCLQD
jgi:hypothetical protein